MGFAVDRRANAEAETWEIVRLGNGPDGVYALLVRKEKNANGKIRKNKDGKEGFTPSAEEIIEGMGGCPGIDSRAPGQFSGRNRLGIKERNNTIRNKKDINNI